MVNVVNNWMKPIVLALVVLCVLLGGGWGYERITSLSARLTEAQESLQDVRDTMASQKQLDATRVKLDQSVRDLRLEIDKTNNLTQRIFYEIDRKPLPDSIVDGLHKGCESLGVACLP